MSDDRVASTLAGIKQREEWASSRYAEVSELRQALADTPILLAAIEAPLKLADDWDAKAAAFTATARPDQGPSRMTRAMLTARAQVLRDCAQALRETITAELAKGDGNHG